MMIQGGTRSGRRGFFGGGGLRNLMTLSSLNGFPRDVVLKHHRRTRSASRFAISSSWAALASMEPMIACRPPVWIT